MVDMFSEIAARVLGTTAEAITDNQRRLAKSAYYAQLYSAEVSLEGLRRAMRAAGGATATGRTRIWTRDPEIVKWERRGPELRNARFGTITPIPGKTGFKATSKSGVTLDRCFNRVWDAMRALSEDHFGFTPDQYVHKIVKGA